MVAAVKITRTDQPPGELSDLAAKSNDDAQVRRLLALALILEGQSRHAATTQAGMDRQTLRDWVHRYNADRVRGLLSIRSGGHPASLTAAQMAEWKELTIKGPNPETDSAVRWRCVDLRDEVARRFTVTSRNE
jgi:transposase